MREPSLTAAASASSGVAVEADAEDIAMLGFSTTALMVYRIFPSSDGASEE
jgi:hypothetical protein